MYEKFQKGVTLLFAAALALLLIGFAGNMAAAMAVGMLLALAAFGIALLGDEVRRAANRKNPITTVKATVVEHRMETYHSRYSAHHQFFITFQIADGDPLEFEVPEQDYQDFGKGDTGPLRYRTWEYISFNRPVDEEHPDPPEGYVPGPEEVLVEVDWTKTIAWLNLVKEKALSWWNKVKEKAVRPAPQAKQPEEANAEKSGILTHEIDE